MFGNVSLVPSLYKGCVNYYKCLGINLLNDENSTNSRHINKIAEKQRRK